MLRERLIEAGVGIVEEIGGLRVLPDDVTLRQACEIVSTDDDPVVPASMYGRVFANQLEYQAQVAMELIAEGMAINPFTLKAIEDGVRQACTRDNLVKPESRHQTLQRLALGAGALDYTVALRDWKWLACVNFASAVFRDDDSPNRVGSDYGMADYERDIHLQLEKGVREHIASYSKIYDWVLTSLGMRLKVGFTFEQLALSVACILEGLLIRARFAPGFLTDPASSRYAIGHSLNGSPDEDVLPLPQLGSLELDDVPVTHSGFLVLTLVDAMTEPDPEFDFDPDVPDGHIPPFPTVQTQASPTKAF